MNQNLTSETEKPGIILPHEHIIHRINIHSGNLDNECVNIELMVKELLRFRAKGGMAVCDLTPLGLGRDPQSLEIVMQDSGVDIISGLGLYQVEVWPDDLQKSFQKEIFNFLMNEIDVTSPGILGEISSHNELECTNWRSYELFEKEKEVFQIFGSIQKRTGLYISTHASFGRGGIAQISAIMEGGGSSEKVVIGHCDAQMHEDIEMDIDYYLNIINQGAFVEFDLFGWHEFMSDQERFKRIAILTSAGFTDQILISTDTCRKSQLYHFGGRGFDYLFTHIIPGLLEYGLSMKEIDQITKINPLGILSLTQS